MTSAKTKLKINYKFIFSFHLWLLFQFSIVLSLLDGVGLSKEDLFHGATLWRPPMNDFSKDKAENKILT
jgi:hypothetical protein